MIARERENLLTDIVRRLVSTEGGDPVVVPKAAVALRADANSRWLVARTDPTHADALHGATRPLRVLAVTCGVVDIDGSPLLLPQLPERHTGLPPAWLDGVCCALAVAESCR